MTEPTTKHSSLPPRTKALLVGVVVVLSGVGVTLAATGERTQNILFSGVGLLAMVAMTFQTASLTVGALRGRRWGFALAHGTLTSISVLLTVAALGWFMRSLDK